MWSMVLVPFILILTSAKYAYAADCPDNWLDCGNSKCIPEMWLCDGENDCLNFKDEENCDKSMPRRGCMSDEFQCTSDEHCIPNVWRCDGEHDCKDESDEKDCVNSTSEECGYRCPDHHCIPSKWLCDGNEDCFDGSDENSCTSAKPCPNAEFSCSSGSCVNRSLVCNGRRDCPDGSDEGLHCGDPCKNITCSQHCESTPSGPQCFCEGGYTLDTKDNSTCLDVNECMEDGFCSQKCINRPGSYECSCLDGYELVNRTCQAKDEDPLLLFSDTTDIRGLRLRSGRYFQVCKAVKIATAVDVDPTTSRIYWIDMSNRAGIFSAKMDGSDMKTVLNHGLLVPEDIAVDYVARNLYLTDSGLRQVLVCKMDGTMCTVLHSQNVSKPRSIVVDAIEGLMYWSDWGQVAGIFKSGMDGTRRMPLVTQDIVWPNGIAIDHTLGRLYFADAKRSTIEYVTLDGSSRKVVLAGGVFHPYSLAVFEDTIYWTDWSTFSLLSCNKFTGHKVELLARENKKHLMGVHVYHPVLQAKSINPCWSSDCSHMCLISESRHFRCACPAGFNLATDQRTCSLEQDFPSLFVSEGSSVFHIRPKSVGSEAISELPLRSSLLITRVAYDPRGRILFIADVNAPAIQAINMTTEHTWDLVKNNLITPEDLAFDLMSNNLYWVDSSKGTVEVISVGQRKRATLVEGLRAPVAIAVSRSGFMFVATLIPPSVIMYDMDGKNPNVLISAPALPMSVAVHPTKSLLYWSDPRAGTISFLNFSSLSYARVIASHLDSVMSVAVSDDYIYWTTRKRELHLLKRNETHVVMLPGMDKGTVSRKVTYSPSNLTSEISPCFISNGGCSYLCLFSPRGKVCMCPTGMIVAADNVTCVDAKCKDSDFKCISNGRCLPGRIRCDSKRDCEDYSDEIDCATCPVTDFKCKNGRCIIKSWRCDHRDDCGDNSDEEDCAKMSSCSKEDMLCTDGACIPFLWRCDGVSDCGDGSDESNCNATLCDPVDEMRCNNGQCLPVSWLCDGADDCFDGTDEGNCTARYRSCKSTEFRCEGNGFCIDISMKCDGRPDCQDGSDEKNCTKSSHYCKNGMFHCHDGHCIYDYEVCDGHKDCDNVEDELNCTVIQCQPEELLCQSPTRCISSRWICDGDLDCNDGSDEENCDKRLKTTIPPRNSQKDSASDCDGFFCYATGICLPWSQVCDGSQDCEDLPDEGGACKTSCKWDCSQGCQKTPQGSRCSCFNGYRLLPDNRTCDDIDECLQPGTCSQSCNNTKGGFKCSCVDGYFLHNDHRTCKAVGGPPTLVYLLGDQIRGIDLSSNSTHVYINVQNADLKGIDYDVVRGIYYYTEADEGSINSYSPQTQRNDVLVRSLDKPHYVRYDWIAENLYYTDTSASIGVCTVDGRFCSTLLHSGDGHIESFDISPATGQMFWTVWSSGRTVQTSGLIERADMDGSHRLIIVSEDTKWPTAITVDKVLRNIYWTDLRLDTLEYADFHGFNRRKLEINVQTPYAMSVFEDYVYWADWGTRSIMRCNKFNGKNFTKIQDGNANPEAIMIVHKAMQLKGVNRCLNSGCEDLCLLTHFGGVCKCRDGYFQRNTTCEVLTTSDPRSTYIAFNSTLYSEFSAPEATNVTFNDALYINSTSVPEVTGMESDTFYRNFTSAPAVDNLCPEGYCLTDGVCTAMQPGQLYCKCNDSYTGDQCQVKVAAIYNKYDYSWVIAVFLAVVMTGCIILIILFCKRNGKFDNISKSVSVKFRKMSEGRHLVVDTDDGSNYDEQLVLEGHEGQYKHCAFGGRSYTLADSKDSDKMSSYNTQAFGDSIVNFFGRLKKTDSSHYHK